MNSAMLNFQKRHQLPSAYIEQAEEWFAPVLAAIALGAAGAVPLFVGINGCQGSGKSTLADYLLTRLEYEHALKVVSISLDDFYYSSAKRQTLAHDVHPLLATRGVPGTHDVDIALQVLSALKRGEAVQIPRFDKSQDDVYPVSQWQQVESAVDVVILEGWCMGVEAQADGELIEPVNLLEQEEDVGGIWRQYVNRKLSEYQSIFAFVNLWVMLAAPSFTCVYQWRLEQEEKLAKRQTDNDSADRIMVAGDIRRFVQFFERITEHGLQTLPQRMDYCYQLDKDRKILTLDKGKQTP